MPTGIYKRTTNNGWFKKGIHPPTQFKKGELLEEKNPNWVGDKITYQGLHKWVVRKLGRPNKCEFCGTISTKKKHLDWANKDHKYKRNIKDWLRLCKSCHRTFDIANNQYKKNETSKTC